MTFQASNWRYYVYIYVPDVHVRVRYTLAGGQHSLLTILDVAFGHI